MGLAAPRKRVKISHDPNNTTWAQSTSGFGHKIMTSQGWTPGSFLGARDANHSDTFTAASASHIRVTLKDDTLGLGARARTLGNDDVAAIDAFQGLLGRLNGKSDVQLEQEQRKRDDTRLALYASKKWQAVTFISGGYLVQEKPDDATKKSDKKKSNSADETSSVEPESGKSNEDNSDNSLSRAEDEKTVNDDGLDGKELKKKKKDKEAKGEKVDKKTKKEKKDKKEKKEKKEKTDKKEKKEKKKEKEAKEKKKEKKDSSKKRRRAEKNEEDESSDTSSADESSIEAVPHKTVTLQAPRPTWRHAIRGRHIKQKRVALMDDRSLGEIFMVKA